MSRCVNRNMYNKENVDGDYNSISSSMRNSHSKIPIKVRNPNLDLSPPEGKKFSLRKKEPNLSIARSMDFELNNLPLSEYSVPRMTRNETNETGVKHRSGKIPSSSKKMDHSHLDRKFESKKKTYISTKENVGKTQAKFMESYKELKEFLQNHEDADYSMPLEEIKLVTLVMNDNQEILIQKDDGTLEPISIISGSINQDSSRFDKIREKLNSTGESASNLCKDILNCFTKFPSESGDAEISERNLKQIKNAMKDAVYKMEDKMCVFNDTVEELESFLSSFVANLKHTKNVQNNSDQEDHNCLDHDEFIKIKSRYDELTEENEKLQKKVKYLSDDIEEKEIVRKQLEMEIEELKAEGTTESLKEELQKLKKDISENKAREEEAMRNCDEEREKCLQLEEELSTYNEIIQELKDELNTQKQTAMHQGKPHELQAEIQSLRENLNKACEEKSLIEKERDEFKKYLDDHNVEQITADYENARKEIFTLKATENSLKENISQLENGIVEKEKRIHYLEEKCSQLEHAEVQEEKRKLKQSDLKKALSEANAKLEQQNELIQKNERLLHVKGETINKLQKLREEENKRFLELQQELHKQNEEMDQSSLQTNKVMALQKTEMKNLMCNLGLKETELDTVEEALEKLKTHNEMLQCIRTQCEKNINKLRADNARLREMMCVNLRSLPL